jgi:16S rRNA (uracil1498-N3)-methyltransferase
MAVPRFFVSQSLADGQTLALPEAAAHHAARVLRLRVHDPVVLFNGEGGEWPGVISALTRDVVTVTLAAHDAVEREAPLRVTLVQAISSGDRMDYTIQKAIELGVHRIVTVEAARSVVKLDADRAAKRVAHWRQVSVAACEQCGRNRVPEILAPVPLAHWLAQPSAAASRWLLSPRGAEPLSKIGSPGAQLELLVGPEGGLTEAEETLALQAGYRAVLLGPRVLRTETAAPALLAAVLARWGDF